MYSHYQLTTESVYEQNKVTQALNFFKETGIHAEAVKTGQYYSRYKLSSEALIGTEKITAGARIFQQAEYTGQD
ncbi:hypothetical protein AAG663_03395 [Bacillus licheniformis]